MKSREAFAWLLLAAIAAIAYTHWNAVKAAWKYRDQLDTAGGVLSDLQQIGVLR